MRWNGARTNWRKGLKPDDLRKRILQVEDPKLRRAAACIVYWDFFGEKMRSEVPQEELDFYLPYTDQPAVETTTEDLAAVLRWIGYPPELALARCWPKIG